MIASRCPASEHHLKHTPRTREPCGSLSGRHGCREINNLHSRSSPRSKIGGRAIYAGWRFGSCAQARVSSFMWLAEIDIRKDTNAFARRAGQFIAPAI